MEGGIVLLLLVFLGAAPSAAAQNNSLVIPVNSSLLLGTDSSEWVSESGIFAFGFYRTRKGYAICISLADSIIEKAAPGVKRSHVVWTANSLNPILPDDTVSLVINRDGIQLFQSIEGSIYKYDYEIAATGELIAGASMLDTGNFVVYNINGSVIWQSFDYPTDTLLPRQRLRVNQELFSRVSMPELGRGIFRLKMQADGNLVQYPVNSADREEYAYYDTDTYGKGNNLSLNLDDSDGRLYLYDGGIVSYNISSGGRGKMGTTYLARVDPDGIFRLYYLTIGLQEGNLTVVWSSTEDRCAPKGICGVNSLCTYEDGQEHVTCTCLPGCSDGCKQDFNIGDCRSKSVRYEMRRMGNITWDYDPYATNDTMTEQECERTCLDDCNCIVASFDNGRCRKQTSPLNYVRWPTTESNMALIRVSLPTSAPATPPLKPPDASGNKKCGEMCL